MTATNHDAVVTIALTPQNVYTVLILLCTIVSGCVYVAITQNNTNTAIHQLQKSQAYQQRYLYAIGSKLNVMPPAPDTEANTPAKRGASTLSAEYSQDLKGEF